MKKRILSLLLALVFCIGTLAACADANEPSNDTTDTTAQQDVTEPTESVIYVDANAADGGNGSENAPFKTVAEAQTKIREMKADGTMPDGGVTVLLANGNYEPIAFTEEDSGTESAPIVYKAAEANGATITGGVTLSADDFVALDDDEKAKLIDEAAKEAVIKVDLTKYGITKDDLGDTAFKNDTSSGRDENGNVHGFAELFIDTERMTLARYPNDDFLKTGETDGVTVFGIKDEVKERAVNWDTENLLTGGYFCYDWSFSTIPVSDVDTDNLTVTLAEEDYYGIAKNRRYFFLNVFAETDMPGEYYIDRENLILYVYPTENFNSASIVLSVSDKDIVEAENASYLNFEQLNFSASRANGFTINGSNINISDCKISGIRANAIEVRGTNITIENNEICDIGDYAILMYGGEPETLTSSNNLIYNNLICKWGELSRTVARAARIYGCGTTISHNEMCDAPYRAIQYEGPNHMIEYNEIYNVCYETDDCGAIYSKRSFTDYGSTIRYNFIHDIGMRGLRADGIFLDDGESGQTLIGNLIVNVSGHGINMGGGRDNVVENNLILDWNYKEYRALTFDNRGRDDMLGGEPEQAQWMADRMKPYQAQQEWLDAFPGYGDIIPFYIGYEGDYDDPMLSGNPSNNVFRNNMFYKMKQTFYAGDNKPGVSYRLIMGMDEYNNVVENCLSLQDYDFVDIPGYENGDYTLAENSQAYQNGFEELPLDQMGRIIEE